MSCRLGDDFVLRAQSAGDALLVVRSVRESATTYQGGDGGVLPMLMYEPGEGTVPVAGVVLFHGGGLHKGSVDEMAPHCRYLAQRGALAVSAGYRLLGQGADGIADCLADARRAMQQFQALAAARDLVPARVAAGGSSAGGILALLATMVGDERYEPARVGVGAIVALNAPVDLLAYPPEWHRGVGESAGIIAGRAADYSPLEFVRPGNPPILLQHGTHDTVVPVEHVRRFREAMVTAGNDCVLIEYQGAGHAFHYPGPGGHFDAVMKTTTEFILERLAP